MRRCRGCAVAVAVACLVGSVLVGTGIAGDVPVAGGLERSDALAVVRASVEKIPTSSSGMLWGSYITSHRAGPGNSLEIFQVREVLSLEPGHQLGESSLALFLCLCPGEEDAEMLVRDMGSEKPVFLPLERGTRVQCVFREGPVVIVVREMAAVPGTGQVTGGTGEVTGGTGQVTGGTGQVTGGTGEVTGGTGEVTGGTGEVTGGTGEVELLTDCTGPAGRAGEVMQRAVRSRLRLKKPRKPPWIEIVPESFQAPRLVEWSNEFAVSGTIAYQLPGYSSLAIRLLEVDTGDEVASFAIPVAGGVKEAMFDISLVAPPEAGAVRHRTVRYRMEVTVKGGGVDAPVQRAAKEFLVECARLDLDVRVLRFSPRLTKETDLVVSASVGYGARKELAVDSDLEIVFSVPGPKGASMVDYLNSNRVFPSRRLPQVFRTSSSRASRRIRWDPRSRRAEARLEVPLAPAWQLKGKGYDELVEAVSRGTRASGKYWARALPFRVRVVARPLGEGSLVMEEKVKEVSVTLAGGRKG